MDFAQTRGCRASGANLWLARGASDADAMLGVVKRQRPIQTSGWFQSLILARHASPFF